MTDTNTTATFTAVPQAGSYATPAGSPDVKAVAKVANLTSKTSDCSTGTATKFTGTGK